MLDWTNIISIGVSSLLGIAAIWKVVSSIVSKAEKYLKIAEEALELANTAIAALKDGKVDAAEVASLQAEYKELMDAIGAK